MTYLPTVSFINIINVKNLVVAIGRQDSGQCQGKLPTSRLDSSKCGQVPQPLHLCVLCPGSRAHTSLCDFMHFNECIYEESTMPTRWHSYPHRTLHKIGTVTDQSRMEEGLREAYPPTADVLAVVRLGDMGSYCLQLYVYFWVPMDSSKPVVIQIALVKLSGPQNKANTKVRRAR